MLCGLTRGTLLLYIYARSIQLPETRNQQFDRSRTKLSSHSTRDSPQDIVNGRMGVSGLRCLEVKRSKPRTGFQQPGKAQNYRLRNRSYEAKMARLDEAREYAFRTARSADFGQLFAIFRVLTEKLIWQIKRQNTQIKRCF